MSSNYLASNFKTSVPVTRNEKLTPSDCWRVRLSLCWSRVLVSASVRALFCKRSWTASTFHCTVVQLNAGSSSLHVIDNMDRLLATQSHLHSTNVLPEVREQNRPKPDKKQVLLFESVYFISASKIIIKIIQRRSKRKRGE